MLTLLRANTWMCVCGVLGINKTVSALWLMWRFIQRISEDPNRAAEAVCFKPTSAVSTRRKAAGFLPVVQINKWATKRTLHSTICPSLRTSKYLIESSHCLLAFQNVASHMDKIKYISFTPVLRFPSSELGNERHKLGTQRCMWILTAYLNERLNSRSLARIFLSTSLKEGKKWYSLAWSKHSLRGSTGHSAPHRSLFSDRSSCQRRTSSLCPPAICPSYKSGGGKDRKELRRQEV